MKKRFSDLRFTDDFIFCRVLESNPEICKEITEIILGVKIKEIVAVDSQHTVEFTPDGRGIRFDVYFENDDTVYDIEMQTTKKRDLRMRTRYYQSILDRKILDKGDHYNKLKKSYIIFICTFDLFGKNLPIYTFENYCLQDKSIKLGDDAVKVFVNSTGSYSGLAPDMIDFIKYIQSGQTDGPLSQKIEQKVDIAKRNPEMEVSYMTFEEMLEDRYEEGLQEGRQEGLKEGLLEGRQEGLKEGLLEGRRIVVEKLLESGIIDKDQVKTIEDLLLE